MKKFLLPAVFSLVFLPLFSQSLPSWITNTKFKGDFRLREEYKDQSGEIERYRTRIRFRIGFETLINEKVKFGAGFATGSGDPRSTNVTLSDSGSKKDFSLDYAYVEYNAADTVLIWGGKYRGVKYILFRPTDLLWDSDITPEGVGFVYKTQISENTKLFFNGSYLVLDEYKSSGADPFIYFVQPGIDAKLGNVKVKAGIAFYSAVHARGNSFDYSSLTNTYDSNGNLVYGYTVLNPNFEVKWKVNGSFVRYFKVFGEYVSNSDAESNDSGYEFGFGFGKKVKKFGDAEIKYNYRYLEKDAWLDIFPDSDAFGGKTDIKGHELEIKYGLGKNVYLKIDYYDLKRIIDDSVSSKLLQIDFNFKF